MGSSGSLSQARSVRSQSALSRQWAEGGGLDGNLILEPATEQPDQGIWGNGSTGPKNTNGLHENLSSELEPSEFAVQALWSTG